MDILGYLVNNIPLFSICAVMIYIAIRNIRLRTGESVLFLVFTFIVLFLSVVVAIERHAQSIGDVFLGTLFTSLGYIFRPINLFLYILLATLYTKHRKSFYLIWASPLVFNTIVYLFPFFFGNEFLSHCVFYYELQADGTAEFMRGGFLNFTSHALCFAYLTLIVYLSVFKFRGKHKKDGMVLVVCVAVIALTVVAEMITGRNDLLNIVCEICAMVNYIFIISVNNSRDALTHLYDRKTYNEDVARYKDQVNGIIMIDMNGLKYINDNFGHEEGDKALKDIADIFDKCRDDKSMVAYRLSGDEFSILMMNGKEDELYRVVREIKEKTSKTDYSIAIGYFYMDKDNKLPYDAAVRKSEELMYEDKQRYYKKTGRERRKF